MTTIGIDLEALSRRIREGGHEWEAGETSMTRIPLQKTKRRLGVS